MASTKTTAVQIEGLSKDIQYINKDIQYIKQQIDDGFRITHEKQDKTNGRVSKLEENQLKLLPKEEFYDYKKESKKGDSQVESEKIISRKEITIAVITALVTMATMTIGLKAKGVI